MEETLSKKGMCWTPPTIELVCSADCLEMLPYTMDKYLNSVNCLGTTQVRLLSCLGGGCPYLNSGQTSSVFTLAFAFPGMQGAPCVETRVVQ